MLVFTLSLLRNVSINKINRRTLVTDNDVIDPLECLCEVFALYTSPLVVSLSVFRLWAGVSQALVCNVQKTHRILSYYTYMIHSTFEKSAAIGL